MPRLRTGPPLFSPLLAEAFLLTGVGEVRAVLLDGGYLSL